MSIQDELNSIYIVYMDSFQAAIFLICVVKEFTSSNSFNVLYTKFHILGPKLDKLSNPW